MRRSSYEYIIPAVLALALTFALIHYIQVLSIRYLLKVERTEEIGDDYFRHYYDLDGDGRSEIIELFSNTSGNLAVKVRYLSESTINQFNLPGQRTEVGTAIDLFDINGDGITDILVCSEKDDSIYLSIIDDVFSHPTTSRFYALDPINRYNENADYSIISGGITDLNADGFPEYVMAVNGGHSLQPRRVYALDFHNDTIYRSPISGAAIHRLDLFDLNGDGVDEILVSTTSTENFNFLFPHMDTTAWLMVLDKELSFYRTPIAMSDHLSFVSLEPFTHEGAAYILSNLGYRNGDKFYSLYSIYDESYKLVCEREMIKPRNRRISVIRDSDDPGLEHLKLVIDQTVYSLGFDLSFTDSLKIDASIGFDHHKYRVDVDRSGDLEYIYPSHQDIVVLRSDLSHPASVDINWHEPVQQSRISLIENGTEDPLIFVHQDSEEAWLSYRPNAWFKYRVLVYPLIFILLFCLFYQTGQLQIRLVKRRYEKDRLISQLQLQSIKNQLDPHFTYNALNAVGSLIYKGEKELAYQYLKGLTDLLRMVSGDASDVTWTLADELGFVRKFLEIEKLRFREKFVYSIGVEEGLMESQVPKLSILTFAENAIKHGLRHKESDRKLDIDAVKVQGGMKIGIRDNGIGRLASGKYREENSGNGITMMKQYLKQFNVASGRKTRFEITDLFKNDHEPAGTLVEIYIT